MFGAEDVCVSHTKNSCERGSMDTSNLSEHAGSLEERWLLILAP